ncbi:hypothetical protein IQ07DRAFT_677244 [Pyrenochaeta sp. DS3sAY3a]|nr:hypothetical protein IQ07DRAFT_677244 [Pyrenochaeta sp. DS3sAY3a]
MEAIAGLSLAANIAQFIDLSAKIFHGAKEIYQSSSGMTQESLELDHVLQSMRLISLKLDPPSSRRANDDDETFRRLAVDCRVLSDQIIEMIQDEISKHPLRKRQAVVAILKNIWTRKERLDLERRLDNCRSQLELHLILTSSSDIRNRLASISTTTDNQINVLKKVHGHLIQLSRGAQVTSLSTAAQNQMRELFTLSNEQYENLAQVHIRKGLATPDMNLRFHNVVNAHDETFKWLFANENDFIEDSLQRSCKRVTAFNSSKLGEDKSSAVEDENAAEQSLDISNDSEWSIWQLDDGFEEPNQDWWYKRDETVVWIDEEPNEDWWYKRDETGVWIDEKRATLQARPENELHQHYLAAGRLFIDWLALGAGFFHILGKLGSGKSTLMKFLFKHPRTKEELFTWAGGKTLVLAKFFFWKPGSPEQKSLDGLFRSLLCEILHSVPDLVATAFPDQWHKVIDSPWQAPPDLHFTDDEIRAAINNLFHRRETYETYAFCLFIDGLDEYQETLQDDYKVLIRILKEWVHLSEGGLKICVSSREYNVFENAFPAERRIRLQDLTAVDMERYARNMLEDLNDEDQKSHLVSEIVSKSDGIFLCVALVVKVFRDYIDDDQDFASFDEVLESLPEEMELLFEHLLATMHKPARQRAYQIFALMAQVKAQYDEELFLLSSIFVEDYARNQKFAMQPVYKYANGDLESLEETAKKRLNGFCRGLVEVKTTKQRGKYIAFTHRSVPEFLERDSTQCVMTTHLKGFSEADAIRQIFLAYLRTVKKPVNHSLWGRFAAKLITDEFESHAPYPYLCCFESAIVDKFGRHGTLEMDCSKPLDQQTLVIDGSQRHRFDNGRSIGNFFLVSPFYLSASFGKLDYVIFRIERDPSLMDVGLKRTFLDKCLALDLGGNWSRKRFQKLISNKRYL